MSMNIPEGYKQTEIGLLSENWAIHFLGEKASKIGSGITPTGGAKVYKKEGRPFLRSQNVGWGQLFLEDIAYIDDITHESFKATEIRERDVFLNITGASIGRSAVADKRVVNGNVNQHVCIIRPIEEELNPYFLNCFLLSKNGQKQIDAFQAGGNRQGLNFGQIKSFKIPLPPTIEEQKAIAQSLSDVDALITECDRLITKKRNIKQGTMQQLLTGKKRLSGFSGEWEVKKLRDVCDYINDGTHHTPQYVNDGIPFYSVENVTTNNFVDTKFISQKEHNFLIKRCHPKKGDILLTRIGTLGETKLIDWDVEASIYVSLALLKLNSNIDTNYLYRYTKSNQFVEDVRKRSLVNATPQKINMGEIGDIPIPLPPLHEQKAIAQILSDMDAEIAALEQKRDKYKAIKQGMMQELLTGKTRLITNC